MSELLRAGGRPYRPAFDARALALGVGVPVLMAAGLGLWLASVAGRMPEPVASHWDASGTADGFSGFRPTAIAAVAVTAGTGALCGTCFALRAAPLGIRRFGIAFSILAAAFCAMIFVCGIHPQIGRANADGTKLDWPLFWSGIALAAIPALTLPWLLKRGGQAAAVPAGIPAGARVDLAGARRGETIDVRIRGSRTLMTVLGALMFAAIGWLAVASWWWLVVAAALTAGVLVFFVATVRAGAAGLSVRILGRWPIVTIPVTDFRAATAVREIRPLQYGGWGYRITGRRSAFVVAAGPAIVLQLAGGRDFAASTGTLENAERMSALLNGYKAISTNAAPGPGNRPEQ
ncbi:DUF1648 domain-containing protein [Arthrobacter sp. I2-34]|uniref:DUF1648 domain-containing protein n=1 Tax=Arthrobacter hankyongi TaxID=2904801 RepID=A0ABS9LCS8_9MICC|nr:DUF1648 domain-containing protein [Arthrobacter hankyongi]MCG2624418.1 DUF1648 domain-containing protein [Arthrobacter hankyongi]